MEDTIFAKIIRREIPAHIVYEDELTLAFLDHSPDSIGHTLVVPKQYFRNIFDLDEKTSAAVLQAARKVAEALKKAVGAEGVTLLMNNERAGGQIVFHAHLHVIPRRAGDGLHYAQDGRRKYRAGEAEEVAENIKAALT